MKKLLVIALVLSSLNSASNLDSDLNLDILKIKCDLAAMYAKRNLAATTISGFLGKKDFPVDELIKYHVFLSAIDFDNREALKLIVYENGWLKISVFGKDTCLQAFYLVLYSYQDITFQKYCLELIEKSWKSSEALGEWYAILYDHIAVAEGKPQRYGTKMRTDGKLYPLEDILNVNKKRSVVGLPDLR